MKKSMITITLLAFMSFFVSCGGSKKDDNKDTVKSDSSAIVKEKKPEVKNFAYFDKISKELKLEGLELRSANKYSDSSSKSFSYGYNIKDGKEKGADYIVLTAGSVARLGNKEDILNKSLDEFKSVRTKMAKNEKDVNISDFKQWEKGGNIFYYCTYKGVSDQMGGKKNYNQLFLHYVKDDVYLDGYLKIYDNKADLAKAEQILIKLMEFIIS